MGNDRDVVTSVIHRAWEYPVLDAIFKRRARRIPWGAEKPGGVASLQPRGPSLQTKRSGEGVA